MLALGEKHGGTVTSAQIYRMVLGLRKNGKLPTPIPATIRASVSRSIARLAERGLVTPTGKKGGFSLAGS